MVIEAQAHPIDCVYELDLNEFISHYPEMLVLRLDSEHIAKLMTIHAKALLGTSYRKMASLFKFLRRDKRGHNCVSVVRSAYTKSTGEDPGWQIPDHVLNSGLFNIVSKKGPGEEE